LKCVASPIPEIGGAPKFKKLVVTLTLTTLYGQFIFLMLILAIVNLRLDRVGLPRDVANRIQQRRMQYFGHVQRMDHTRYLKLALHGYVHGTRIQGRPKKRWIDMVKDECKQRDIDIHQATQMTHRPIIICNYAKRSLMKKTECENIHNGYFISSC